MISLLNLLAKAAPVVNDTPIKPEGLPTAEAGTPELQAILTIVFGIIGGLAFLMIVISGFRYILSSGDPGNMGKAKDGIIYALIGLLVALTAEAIIAFVARSL